MADKGKDPTGLHSPTGSGAGETGGGRPERALPPLDASIIEGVRRRDRDALGTFFEHYFGCVYGLAYRLLGNRAGAEDATQDVFYKVHQAAHKLDPQRDPVPWLVTITLNTCRSFWRSTSHKMEKKSSTLDTPADRTPELANSARGPEDRLLAAEQERKVQEAVTQLPETLRTVVILRDYQGLGHSEIASLLGLTHEAVRKRYSRALSELGNKLKGILE